MHCYASGCTWRQGRPCQKGVDPSDPRLVGGQAQALGAWERWLQPAVVGAKQFLAGGVWEGGWVGGPKKGERHQRGVKGRSRHCPFLPGDGLGPLTLGHILCPQ